MDPFDPNNWVNDNHEYRIYGDDRASIWAVVDEIDYHWAIKYRWCIKLCRYQKPYLRRAVGVNQNGQRLRTFSLYLHIEIMKNTGIAPPGPAYKIVDHRNGNSLDCRRQNLRWATHSMNSRNVRGSHASELFDLGV